MVDHVKSAVITNLDASPSVQNTMGEGGPGRLKSIEGYNTALASGTVDSTYQWVRVKSNCKIKRIDFESEAQGAGAVDIGLYYATDGQGGKATSLLASSAIDQDFFATAVSAASSVQPTNVTNESTTYTINKRTLPLWSAVGLSVDPGGSFDIVGTVTTSITTGTGKWGVTVYYTD